MKSSDVIAIVVNWKLKEDTERCIESLERLDHPCQIILVDNGSEDGSAEYLAQRFPHLQIIALPVNVGFGAAVNCAIRHVLSQPDWNYVFLLNNDATIHPHAITELLSITQKNPDVGIFGPKVYYNHPADQLWYAGARRRRGVLAAADTGRGQKDASRFDILREVDYVFGAAMLIRRQVFERIGLFDERFFLYLEDWDFCLRAQQGGFRLFYVPQSHVHHKGSASTVQYRSLRKYHYARSTILFLKKHTSLLFLLPNIIFWSFVFAKTASQDIFQGDLKILGTYLSGLFHGLFAAFHKPSPSDEQITLSR